MFRRYLFLVFLIVILTPITAGAHQPRYTMCSTGSPENPIVVHDAEISKAFYSVLKGYPQYYRISSEKPFSLYVNILIPANSPDKNFVSAEVLDSSMKNITILDGTKFNWIIFYEKYGRDYYLMGPEYRAEVNAGTYYIKVFNDDNSGKYTLATGEKEAFPPREIIRAIIIVPILKLFFF